MTDPIYFGSLLASVASSTAYSTRDEHVAWAYHPELPYQITLGFEDGRSWTVGRRWVALGLQVPQMPQGPTQGNLAWPGQRQWYLQLLADDTVRIALFRRADVEAFLTETYNLVSPGSEEDYAGAHDWDSALRELLGGAR